AQQAFDYLLLTKSALSLPDEGGPIPFQLR
ncbi:MAG: hypothetical protein ACI8P3_000997, partial [Saprospiraceae bacterium]